jgi:DNA-binding transcriptional ArsR family regulator
MTTALQLLGEPRRMEMLRLVWDTERAAGDIARHFQITFGAVSQHLGVLWRSGLLRRRRDGKRILYLADKAALGPLAAALEAMWSERLATLKELAETEQKNMNRNRSNS